MRVSRAMRDALSNVVPTTFSDSFPGMWPLYPEVAVKVLVIVGPCTKHGLAERSRCLSRMVL